MSEWMAVADCENIAPGTWEVSDIDDDEILVINLDGHFYVIEDVCSHDGASLADGFLENDEIVCPRHGARFCARSGEVTCPPAYENIHSFPVKVENGKIYTRDDRDD